MAWDRSKVNFLVFYERRSESIDQVAFIRSFRVERAGCEVSELWIIAHRTLWLFWMLGLLRCSLMLRGFVLAWSWIVIHRVIWILLFLINTFSFWGVRKGCEVPLINIFKMPTLLHMSLMIREFVLVWRPHWHGWLMPWQLMNPSHGICDDVMYAMFNRIGLVFRSTWSVFSGCCFSVRIFCDLIDRRLFSCCGLIICHRVGIRSRVVESWN